MKNDKKNKENREKANFYYRCALQAMKMNQGDTAEWFFAKAEKLNKIN